MGYRPGVSALGPREKALLEEAEALTLETVRPQAIWTFPVDPETLGISDGIRRRIAGNRNVACFALTAGGALDQLITKLFAAGKVALGATVDACGSAAAEAVARLVQQEIANRMKEEGKAVRIRLSPGYSGWPLSANELLLKASGGSELGIRVLSGGLLLPRKSVLGIIPVYEKEAMNPALRKTDR
ncbi:MAG TPA: hypothetical protein GXX40_00545 [Firmicutes bacterium]|nr:hypothetical protein [Bacillota bacterium]